jgi:hypothetical protein
LKVGDWRGALGCRYSALKRALGSADLPQK